MYKGHGTASLSACLQLLITHYISRITAVRDVKKQDLTPQSTFESIPSKRIYLVCNETNDINEIDDINEIISCLCTNVPQNPPLGGGPGVQRTPGKRRGQNPGSRFEKKAFSCSELAV